MVKTISGGKKSIFIATEKESTKKNFVKKWIQIYNQMLKNIGCNTFGTNLTADIIKVLKTE